MANRLHAITGTGGPDAWRTSPDSVKHLTRRPRDRVMVRLQHGDQNPRDPRDELLARCANRFCSGSPIRPRPAAAPDLRRLTDEVRSQMSTRLAGGRDTTTPRPVHRSSFKASGLRLAQLPGPDGARFPHPPKLHYRKITWTRILSFPAPTWRSPLAGWVPTVRRSYAAGRVLIDAMSRLREIDDQRLSAPFMSKALNAPQWLEGTFTQLRTIHASKGWSHFMLARDTHSIIVIGKSAVFPPGVPW